MNPDLAALRITAEEIERLIGLDVNEIFIGGAIGGVYRTSVFEHSSRLLTLIATELVVAALVFAFSIPVGLGLTQANGGSFDLPATLRFLQITVGITLAVMFGWNGYMQYARKRFALLMPLLDEVDRYNEMIEAVAMLFKLEELQSNHSVALPSEQDRTQILEALRMTRDSLVSGLLTEKILRESRGLLARRQDLLANIETNLAALQTLEINQRASEYRTVLNEALQIGMTVYQEVQKLSLR
ncbi:hypothetical protein H6F89_33015 [Cyanobacteria bacterium FACHB-63]|nr:hypothetical protein [Cyanobacteria bacterium FACHB-63]